MFGTETVNSIISVLSSIISNEDGRLMWRIVTLIQENTNLNFVSLYLVDSKEEFTVMKAGTGRAGQKLIEREHKLLLQHKPDSQTVVVSAINSNKVSLCDYLGSEPYFTAPSVDNTVWELAFPLRAYEHVIGVLEIEGTEKALFHREDTLEFQRVADEVSRLLIQHNLV